MEQRITAIYPGISKYLLTNIFGYASKGIPGLEIIGLGNKGKSLKEKFIFLTKKGKIRPPLRRYVICVEEDEEVKEQILDNYRWLELPMFILFWSLANILPIVKLDDCISSGQISVTGNILLPEYNLAFFDELMNDYNNNWKLIYSKNIEGPTMWPLIFIEELFNDYNLFKIDKSKMILQSMQKKRSAKILRY